MLLNLLLLVPFALGLRLAGVPALRVVLFSAIFSGTVESLQFALIPGRDASLSDLLTNTISGALGAALGRWLGALLFPAPQNGGQLTIAACIVWLSTLMTTAWLLTPWVPELPLHGSWAGSLVSRPAFSGTVAEATLAGLPLSDGLLLEPSHVRTMVNGGTIDVAVSARSGRPTDRWAPIVSLYAPSGVVLGLNQIRHGLVFEYPARSAQLRLRDPAVVVEDALPDRAGTAMHLAAGARERTLWVQASWPGRWRRYETTLRPTLGWSLLLPFEYAYDAGTDLLTALWIVGLTLPIGYWSRAAARGGNAWWLAVPVLAIVLGSGGVPVVTGYPPAPDWEWLAATGGVAAGWVLYPAAAYLASRCGFPSIGESSLS